MTERQLSKGQPYHRRVGFRVDFPQAASFFVRYRKVIIHDDILSAVEVATILCKVTTTHCENEENNLTEYGVKVLGRVSLQWNLLQFPPPPPPPTLLKIDDMNKLTRIAVTKMFVLLWKLSYLLLLMVFHSCIFFRQFLRKSSGYKGSESLIVFQD